jgi:predicted small metal-binding protein
MKTLACKDLGVMECGFVAKAETTDEAIRKASDHANKVHAEKMKQMAADMTDAEMKQAMMAAIKNV